MRGEREAAGHAAQHEPAAVEVGLELLRGLRDRLLRGLQRVGELLDRHRVGREEQQRLEPGGERHAAASARSAWTVISPNGSACSHAASPRL